MKRLVFKAIFKTCIESILLAAITGAVIGIIGYTNKWDSSIAYSNGLFLAGCLVIVAGASTRLAAGQEWRNFQLLDAESFHDMSSSERATYVIDASSSVHLVILGLLSGLLLVLAFAVAAAISKPVP